MGSLQEKRYANKSREFLGGAAFHVIINCKRQQNRAFSVTEIMIIYSVTVNRMGCVWQARNVSGAQGC
jgi:hypothetical protein